MRVADTIPHPRMRIIIYTLDKHYYVEFEAGPMKQGFRFSKEQTGGAEGVKRIVEGDLCNNVEARFHQMHTDAFKALKKAEL